MSSREKISLYRFDRGVIIELYRQNLITEQEKNACLEKLMKEHSVKGEENNEY